MTAAPPATAARFAPADPPSPADLLRLLEVGDDVDLRWLLEVSGPQALGDFVTRHGGRLSQRSRAFWALALEREAPSPAPLARALWPLLG